MPHRRVELAEENGPQHGRRLEANEGKREEDPGQETQNKRKRASICNVELLHMHAAPSGNYRSVMTGPRSSPAGRCHGVT